ncbi:MAG TPA: hypothetical protein VI653_13345 [Steroidobacteraceae bacterium]
MPYTVEFGPSCSQKVEFAEFGYALAFYRGYLENRKLYVGMMSIAGDDGPRIVNYDRAELGNSGLTEDEKEQVSNAEG